MDTSGSGQVVARPAKRSWRRHSEEFKTRVIEMARQPHTSVAAVALANGLNANMLRRWVREADVPSTPDHEPPVPVPPTFVRLPVPATEPMLAPAPTSSTDAPPSIVVEIQRRDATVRANLPLCPASAAWLREVLG